MSKKAALIFFFFLSVIASFAQDKMQRIKSSYLLAFGRQPRTEEINWWKNNTGEVSLDYLYKEHQKNIKNDNSLKESAIKASYFDAFGRQPDQREYNYWKPYNLTYVQLMEKHTQYLKDYRDSFEVVVGRSYKWTFIKPAREEDIKVWMNGAERLPFQKIVASHFLWNQKYNNDDFQALTPIASAFRNSATPTKLSATVAKEFLNIMPSSLIFSGGAQVISTGGLNVISTGGLNVISTGGLNLIGQAGGN